MGQIITAKTYVENLEDPLIFLAGPIGSAPPWHEQAIDYLFYKEPNLNIASPKSSLANWHEYDHAVGIEEYFHRQRAWEWRYMEIASKEGAILFWLPKEERHRCHKVYGATTRVELGQWMTRYSMDNDIRLCIGGENWFPEFSTIRYDIELHAPDMTVHKTIKETCDEALRLACS